jgi:hypothetical protein
LPRPNLTLAADSTTIYPDSPVRYSAGVDLPNVHPSRWKVIRWEWKPDDPSVAPNWSESKPDTVHIGPMRWSGTTTVVALIEGIEERASVHITVREPPQITMEATAAGMGAVVGVDPGTTINYKGRLASDSAAWWSRTSWVKWTYKADDGTYWEGSYGSPTHTGPIQKTGVVTIIASINGRTRTTSKRIRVVPCAINDSVYDEPAMRKLLSDTWDSTNAGGAITARREGGGGYLFRDPATGTVTRGFYPQASGSEPCRYEFPIAPAQGTFPDGSKPWWAFWRVHPHPWNAGEVIPGSMCPQTTGGITGSVALGPSDSDYKGADGNVTNALMDSGGITEFEGHPSDNTKWKTTRYIPRKHPSKNCFLY